jgi:hypothetical protein
LLVDSIAFFIINNQLSGFADPIKRWRGTRSALLMLLFEAVIFPCLVSKHIYRICPAGT